MLWRPLCRTLPFCCECGGNRAPWAQLAALMTWHDHNSANMWDQQAYKCRYILLHTNTNKLLPCMIKHAQGSEEYRWGMKGRSKYGISCARGTISLLILLISSCSANCIVMIMSTKSVEVRSHNIPKCSGVSNKMRSKNQRSTVNIMLTIIWNKPVASSPPLVSLTASEISVQQPAPFNRPIQIRKKTAT